MVNAEGSTLCAFQQYSLLLPKGIFQYFLTITNEWLKWGEVLRHSNLRFGLAATTHNFSRAGGANALKS